MPEQVIAPEVQSPSIYSFLKENGLTDKDEQLFNETYKDSAKAKELHGFFTENQLTEKDFDTFYADNFGTNGVQQPVNQDELVKEYNSRPLPTR